MDRRTVEVYERRGLEWAAKAATRVGRRADARAFARRVAVGDLRVDLGCGAGRYTGDVGRPVLALDAARTMLDACAAAVPRALLVQGDIEALPIGRGTLGGAWANMSYLHLPSTRLPMALAELHRALKVGTPFDLQLHHGDYEGDALPGDDIGGRFFASWTVGRLADVLTGAGFSPDAVVVDGDVVRAQATRLRSLADHVGPGMRILAVGLNPSPYAADSGVGFARPGNRFWPAVLQAGLATRDRDPADALRAHGLGMTDLVKRPTVSASELGPAEYVEGMARVERLVRWLEPRVVCMVGLAGWRAAVDRRAVVGVQDETFGRRPVYVMPNPSGANAHVRPADVAEHLRAVARLADET